MAPRRKPTNRPTRRGRGTGGGSGLLMLAVVVAGLWWLLDGGSPSRPAILAALTAPGGGVSSTPPAPSAAAVADIPPAYLALYRQSGGTCAGLDWALLAGVGKVESDHGRLRAPGVRSGTNFAGAGGPMQFLRPTWREVRGNHPEVGPDIYDPAHAIPAAAHYLCDGGLTAGRGVRAALWTYNRSRPYATDVLATADRYRAAAGGLS